MSLDQIAAAYDGADRLQTRVQDLERRLGMAQATEAQASTALEAERTALASASTAWRAESDRLTGELKVWTDMHARSVSATASAESRATEAARAAESLPSPSARGTAILHRDVLRRKAGGLRALRDDLSNKVAVIAQKLAGLPTEPSGEKVDQLLTQKKAATVEVAALGRELNVAREELGRARAALQEAEAHAV